MDLKRPKITYPLTINDLQQTLALASKVRNLIGNNIVAPKAPDHWYIYVSILSVDFETKFLSVTKTENILIFTEEGILQTGNL